METESTNHQDVAEPDQMVSGVAGTGHEYNNKNGIIGKPEEKSPQLLQKRNREIIGLGILYNGKPHAGKNAGESLEEAASSGKDEDGDLPESAGDLIFALYDRQDRISDRLNKKIGRLDKRLTKLEERGRS